jgi:transglutaminase-like putative cysteine protease
MTPRHLPWQTPQAHAVVVEPTPTERWQREDYFGNPVLYIAVLAPHSVLHVRATSTVEIRSRDGFRQLEDSPPWDRIRERLQQVGSPPLLEASQFLFESPHVSFTPALTAYAAPSFAPGRPLLAAARELMLRIHEEFEFDPKATTVATPLAEVLARRRGVCQDFAHLMIGCLRSLGIAARYVSGYLLTTPPPGQPRLVGADASHAWVSVYCPETGWTDFDPTNNLLPDLQHITLAYGRDFSDVSPLRGVILGGSEQVLDVRVTVTPCDTDAPVDTTEAATGGATT